MKKYFVPIALILLLAGSASYAWMGAGQMAGSVPAEEGSTCSGNYGNAVTTDAGYTGTTADRLYLQKITIDCTGTATWNGRLRYFNTDILEGVFAIYSDNAGVPYLRLWYSSPWYNAGNTSAQSISMATSTELEAGDYWVGLSVESASRYYYSAATGGTSWLVITGDNFPTPPADLTGIGAASEVNNEVWLSF